MVGEGCARPFTHPSPPFTSNDFSAADKGKLEVQQIGIRLK